MSKVRTLLVARILLSSSIAESTKFDADVSLVNNVSAGDGDTDHFATVEYGKLVNNQGARPDSDFADIAAMDFRPKGDLASIDGAPVDGVAVSYVGAVDPAVGMWSYGVDESLLPRPSSENDTTTR